jgi:DNA-binding MarR family transcriptional regulator
MQELCDPLDNLVFLSNRVGRLLANAIRREADFEAWGVKSHHMGLLVDLWRKDGLRQQDLAISVIKDKANITRLLDHLASVGLIERLPDEQDKRIKRIFLTERGRAMQEHFWPVAAAVVERAVAEVSPEDLAICKDVLRNIYRHLVLEQDTGFIEKN